jgi:hypothetical protein
LKFILKFLGSYIGDALSCREETPSIERNEGTLLLEWAHREAAELGLLPPATEAATSSSGATK